MAQAAAGITIAVIDTGADLTAPDLSAKAPRTYSVRTGQPDVPDTNGHGTFVAALAAGSTTNGDGIAGSRRRCAADGRPGRRRRQAPSRTSTRRPQSFMPSITAQGSSISASAARRPLRSSGARSTTRSRRASLLVAAVGNGYLRGNAVEYPAALLQPVGSNGVGGRGLSVGASTPVRAPGAVLEHRLAHLAGRAGRRGSSARSLQRRRNRSYPRVALPGSLGGFYGYAAAARRSRRRRLPVRRHSSGRRTPLRADEVASILEQTASGQGKWNPELGYGVLDVAAAVAKADGEAEVAAQQQLRSQRSVV